MADNIFQKPGESTWYVRYDIPKDVRRAFGGRRVLQKTLKTASRSEAMDRRHFFLNKWKEEVKAARAAKAASADEWKQIQHETGLALLAERGEAATRLYTSRGGKKSESVDHLTFFQGVSEVISDLVEDGYPHLAKRLQDHALHRIEKLESGMTIVDGIILHNEWLDFRSEVSLQATVEEYDLSEEEEAEARSITVNPSEYKPRSPITDSRLKKFRTYRTSLNLGAKPIDTQEAKLKKLSAFLSAEGLPLNFDSVSAFIESLTDLTSKTKDQYLLAGSVFWKWAMKYDSQWKEDFGGLANPFVEHDLPKVRGKEAKDSKREAFTIDEAVKLHSAALAKKDSGLVNLITFGAYTGARIEEICQLRVEDLIIVDGVHCFDIPDAKTIAGIRKVPIHPNLASLVKELAASSKDGYLFPIKTKNKYAIRSDALSKRFGRLKTELGFGRRHVFHSFRHTIPTLLHQAGVTHLVITDIMGHETGTVTFDVYSKGSSAQQKFEAICKLSFPFAA